MQRRFALAGLGTVLAAGAPAGLAVVWWARAPAAGLDGVVRTLRVELATFAYVAASTAVVFAAFGYVVGRQADALAELSRTDPLTGLANHLGFEQGLRDEIARARRYGAPLSLLVADVDGLKAVNDRAGHAAGNVALRIVARALWHDARRTDVVARIGGDEFAVVAPHTHGDDAMALAERIRALVNGQREVEGLTLSIGVATLDARRPDAGALFAAADEALYAAKRRGRNAVARAAGVTAG